MRNLKSNLTLPHKVAMSHTEPTLKMSHWCEEQFGVRWDAVNNCYGEWCCFWSGQELKYNWYFKKESQLSFFLLRWG